MSIIDRPGGSFGGGLTNTDPPRGGDRGWTNTDPPRGGDRGWTNTDPPRGGDRGWTNTDPPRGGDRGWTNTDPPRGGDRGGPIPSPLPWEGIDPAWVYDDPTALLSQALRRSRSRIVRPADGALLPDAVNDAARRGHPLAGTHLWRWEPEWRIKAVTAELMGRCQVLGATVWLVDPGAAGRKPAFKATQLIDLSPPADLDTAAQVDKVLRAAAEREDRLPEILTQMRDFWPFFESVSGLQLRAAPRFEELLNVAYDWAHYVLLALKNHLGAKRPMQASSLVMPVIATPGHGALPSGHATISALTSELLAALLAPRGGDRADSFDRLARRIAYNRVVAGVHFPVDNLAGYRLGTQLARLLLSMADPKRPRPAPLRPADVYGRDHQLKEIGVRPAAGRPGRYALSPAPQLAAMWTQVKAEVATLRI